MFVYINFLSLFKYSHFTFFSPVSHDLFLSSSFFFFFPLFLFHRLHFFLHHIHDYSNILFFFLIRLHLFPFFSLLYIYLHIFNFFFLFHNFNFLSTSFNPCHIFKLYIFFCTDPFTTVTLNEFEQLGTLEVPPTEGIAPSPYE